ncbi:MAG: hypothetical protein KOO60_04565 [Gemmatimonadales bacterium]|nr:hypothetical protein [Gemmatimonadales bacterium]
MKCAMATILTLVVAVSISTSALADDFMPPEFRGDYLTVMAEWDFLTDWGTGDIPADNLVTVGDGGDHLLGGAWTHTHDVFDNLNWVEDPSDPQDGVAMSGANGGQLGFYLVNWIDDYQFKHLWIQITYGGEGVPFVSSVVGPNPLTNSWPDPTYGIPGDVGPFEVDADHRVEYWLLMPNPDREYVYIDIPPFTWVDQVVIDTISTMEPVGAEESSWDSLKALFR